MIDWDQTTIGDLINRWGGNIKTGPFGTTLKASEYTKTGVPLISVGEIGYGCFRVGEHTPRVDVSVTDRLPEYVLEKGDIVFSRKGAVDRSAIVTENEAGWFLGSDGIRLRLPPNVNHRFVHYALSSKPIRTWLLQQSTGSTMASLNQGIIARLPLRLPPRDVQDAIADALSTLDHKIELNNRTNETLEAVAQAIFRDWFVEFGPTRRKRVGATDPLAIMGVLTSNPAQAAKLAALFPIAMCDDGLPEGWTSRAIGDLIDIAGGSTPSTTDELLWQPAEHRWATPKDLSGMSDLALFDTDRRISSAGLAKITSGLQPMGTVLLSSRAPIGYLAIAQKPVAINQGFIALKPTADLGSAYLYLWCKANMDAIVANANGSTFQEISKKNFRPILSAVPGQFDILREFSAIAQPLIDRIVSGAWENKILAETRDYLLPRLMSGAVRVTKEEEAA